MRNQFKTLIYAAVPECNDVEELFRAQLLHRSKTAIYRNVDSYEEFQMHLVDWTPDLVIVAYNGAAGMEGVYLSNNRRPATPVIWFSDDQIFAMQSHRLDCAYFSTKPVTAEKVSRALRQCIHVGILPAQG